MTPHFYTIIQNKSDYNFNIQKIVDITRFYLFKVIRIAKIYSRIHYELNVSARQQC